jgi:hypothetical protein
MMRIVVGLAAALALSACAVLSESQCRGADWRALGVRDGEHGSGPEHLGEYARSCDAYGVRPGQSDYDAGRQAGLARYCSPRNGYLRGAIGDAYLGVCPKDVEPQFVAELLRGRLLRPPTPQLIPFFEAVDRDERALAAALTDEERARLRAGLMQNESWIRRLLNRSGTFTRK